MPLNIVNLLFFVILFQARKKAEKEAEHEKFLKWKEEKLRKEMELVSLTTNLC